MRNFIFLLSLMALPCHAFAQYEGGDGDGTDAILVIQLDLEGIPAGVRALYIGGQGDGYTNSSATNALNGQFTLSLYNGGNGDGYDRLSENFSLSGEDVSILFGGGAGDGFDQISESISLDGVSLVGIYGGGAGDGFDQIPLSSALDGALSAAIYGGGNGDGFDNFSTTGSLGMALAMLYGGGAGDGFDRMSTLVSLGGDDLSVLFGGGNGDGYAPTNYVGIIPLPLTLISFDAFPEEEYVLLRWVTEDEIGTDFFTIEKTREGRDFAWVGALPAAGFSESGQRLDYELKDLNPYEGTSYYRLRTTDFDGAISLSHLVQVHYAQAADWNFQIFPNPNTGQHFSLRTEGVEQGQDLVLEITDVNGRVLLNERFIAAPASSHRFDLQERLSAGSYLIRVLKEGKEQQAKILVVVGR